MAFDRQNITNQGMYLIRRLKDGCRINFTAMFTEVSTITPAMMPTGGGVTYTQAVGNPERFSEGQMWSVSTEKTDFRAVAKFRRDDPGAFVMRSAYLFATLLDETNNVAVDEHNNPLENILFAVASNDEESVLQSDGRNSLYVTFQLVLTNGYSQIITVENGVATLEDLESVQNKNDTGRLSLRFDSITGDLQLFDGEGNLIDQANLPAQLGSGSGIGGVVNGKTVWVSMTHTTHAGNTLYRVPSVDGYVYAFVSGFDPDKDLLVKENPSSDEAVSYMNQVKAFVVGKSGNHLTVTDTGKAYDEVRALMSAQTLRQPKVTDFFSISEDRSDLTLDNIGQDTVITNISDITDPEVLASLWRGYARIAAEDPSVLVEIDEDLEVAKDLAKRHPELLDPERFLIPPMSVDPTDFKAVYSNAEQAELQLKYQVLADVPVDTGGGVMSTLNTVTRTRLLRVLKGLYEKQVQNARIAYLMSSQAFEEGSHIDTDAPSIAIDSTGISFMNDGQTIKLSVNSENGNGPQKLSLSRISGDTEQIFAFIGDSGAFGGAPLFSVLVSAHAHYTGNTKNWLLNSIKISDGYVAEIAGQRYNSVPEPVMDKNKNDHMYVTCAEKLSLPQDMTHVVVDILGYMGVNRTPVEQYKHIGCIVPFNKEINSQSVNANRFGCDIDLTLPLNSWIQTPVEDVDGTQNTPDVFVVRAYAINFTPTEIPSVDPPQLLTYHPFSALATAKNGAYMVDAVYDDGSTVMFSGLPVTVEDGKSLLIEAQSDRTVGGNYWYQVRVLDEDNNPVLDEHGNPKVMYVSGRYVNLDLATPDYEIGAFNKYAKIPSGTVYYNAPREADMYHEGELSSVLYTTIAQRTTNGFYAVQDINLPYGMKFFVITEDILLDTIEDQYDEKESDDSVLNVPISISSGRTTYRSVLSDGEICNPITHTEDVSALVKKGWEKDTEYTRKYTKLAIWMDSGSNPLRVVNAEDVSVLVPEIESIKDTTGDDPVASFHRILPFQVEIPYTHQYTAVHEDTLEVGTSGSLDDVIEAVFETNDLSAWGIQPTGSEYIYFIRKDMTFYTGTPQVDESVTEEEVDRYFIVSSGHPVTVYMDHDTSSVSSQLTSQGPVHVTGFTSNGFCRISSGGYVLRTDIELDATKELLESASDPSTTLISQPTEASPITVYSHCMADGTLTGRSAVLTDGTLTAVKLLSGTVCQFTYAGSVTPEPKLAYLSQFQEALSSELYEDIESVFAASEITPVTTSQRPVTTTKVQAVEIHPDGTMQRIVIEEGTQLIIIGMGSIGEDDPTPGEEDIYSVSIGEDLRTDKNNMSVLASIDMPERVLRHSPGVIFTGTSDECDVLLSSIQSQKALLDGTSIEDNTVYTKSSAPIDATESGFSVWIDAQSTEQLSENRAAVVKDFNKVIGDVAQANVLFNTLLSDLKPTEILSNVTWLEARAFWNTLHSGDSVRWYMSNFDGTVQNVTNVYSISQVSESLSTESVGYGPQNGMFNAAECAGLLLRVGYSMEGGWTAIRDKLLQSTKPTLIWDNLTYNRMKSLMEELARVMVLEYDYEYYGDEAETYEPYMYWCTAEFSSSLPSWVPNVKVPNTSWKVTLTSKNTEESDETIASVLADAAQECGVELSSDEVLSRISSSVVPVVLVDDVWIKGAQSFVKHFNDSYGIYGTLTCSDNDA